MGTRMNCSETFRNWTIKRMLKKKKKHSEKIPFLQEYFSGTIMGIFVYTRYYYLKFHKFCVLIQAQIFWGERSNSGQTLGGDPWISPPYSLGVEVNNFQNDERAPLQIPASAFYSEAFSNSEKMTCPGLHIPRVSPSREKDLLDDNLEACFLCFLREELLERSNCCPQQYPCH